MIEFEWDKVKSKSNQKKHGISFEEAKTVFDDDFAVQFFDEENSSEEDRFLMLGYSNKSNLSNDLPLRTKFRRTCSDHFGEKSHETRTKILLR